MIFCIYIGKNVGVHASERPRNVKQTRQEERNCSNGTVAEKEKIIREPMQESSDPKICCVRVEVMQDEIKNPGI